MRKWFVVIFILVVVTALISSGLLQLISSLQSEEIQNTPLLPLIAAGGTGLIASVIVTIMQWMGISPLDLLPERTPEQILRRRNPDRFRLTKSKDVKLLEGAAKAAWEQKEYEWAVIFARAWAKLRPNAEKAFEIWAESLIELEHFQEAIPVAHTLIKIDSLSYDGYSALGDAYTNLGQTAEAKVWYERALQYAKDEQLSFVLPKVIKSYMRLGFLDEAIAKLHQLLPIVDVNDGFSKNYYGKMLHDLESIKRRIEATTNDLNQQSKTNINE